MKEAELFAIVARFHFSEIGFEGVNPIVVFFLKVGIDTGDTEISLRVGGRERERVGGREGRERGRERKSE